MTGLRRRGLDQTGDTPTRLSLAPLVMLLRLLRFVPGIAQPRDVLLTRPHPMGAVGIGQELSPA
jgi:hypothetical protein